MAAPATVGGEFALDRPLTGQVLIGWEGERQVMIRKPGYLP